MTTHCSYQGIPAHSCVFRRTRGWEADVSTVTFLAKSFPKGFRFAVARAGELAPPRTPAEIVVDWARKRPLFGSQLTWAGQLVLAERDEAGREFVVAVTLYCLGMEVVRRDAQGRVSLVQAKLVDERYFWSRGFVRRWSFNRTGADGELRLDSVRADGARFSLEDVAGLCSSWVFGSPSVARLPAAWSKETPELELQPFGSARGQLIRLAREHGLLQPSLGFDGSLSLWQAGEGVVGAGPQNATPLPRELLLYEGGSGQGEGEEATYPPDWVVVVGGLRIASVRLGRFEPVLVIQGEPVPLNEHTVQVLTKGKYGIEWLRGFVLAPLAWQNDAVLRPAVVQLFREQAWKLWRLLGVEVEVDAKVPAERIESLLAGRRQETRDAKSRVPGRNAHLLPLLPRAETQGGRRLPIQVEAYRFASTQITLAPAKEQQTIAAARKALRDLKQQIERIASLKTQPSPWAQSEWFFLFSGRYANSETLWQYVKEVQESHVSHEEFMGFLEQARLVDRIREVAPGLAGRYEQELAKLYAIDGEQGGTSPELWELARELVGFEKSAAEQRDAFEGVDSEIEDQAETLRKKLAGKLRALKKKREEQRRRRRSLTRKRQFKPQHAHFVRNLPRKVDPDARIYSAELGIVRTRELCGHVREEGVPVAEATSFVPRPPRVTFGAVLRPRVTSRRVVTGAAQEGDAIPEVLGDVESHYTAAFRRLAPGNVKALPLTEVPDGAGTVVRRPDLVELVPLQGSGNRAALDQTTEAIARALTSVPPTRRGGHLIVARPWAVECNGVVAGVEIRLRPGARGFTTTIQLGSEATISPSVGSTRVRPQVPSDAAAREGL